MSDDNKNDDILHQQLEEDALQERKRKEVLSKELVVRERKADIAVSKIVQGDKEMEQAKSVNYGVLTPEDVAEIQRENDEYLMAARNIMPFIVKDTFTGAVPFFRKNLILIGATSGDGKSATVANVVLGMMGKNPATGKLRRVLIITNEERREDVYNRITCLIKGWHYVNHNKFTDEQHSTFREYIHHLSKNGRITVIDDAYAGILGTTTTIEGICQIFENLIRNKEYFDAIIIDYYQNVISSKLDPTLPNWKVQEMLKEKLDSYKNIYPAPIVVMAQLTPVGEDDTTPFKIRIEGRKAILNAATCALEMVAHKEDLCTEWIVHKSRFNEMVGMGLETGYDKGRFVEYTEEFRIKVNQMKAARDKAAQDKAIGMPPQVATEENEDE